MLQLNTIAQQGIPTAEEDRMCNGCNAATLCEDRTIAALAKILYAWTGDKRIPGQMTDARCEHAEILRRVCLIDGRHCVLVHRVMDDRRSA